MREKITLCGDDCALCPRYHAKTDKELRRLAELWHRIGWRETVVSPDEMRFTGCSSHKKCTFQLVDCTNSHGVVRCADCPEFPCEKIRSMLERSQADQKRCQQLCTPDEFAELERAFFHKPENLHKPRTEE